MRAALAWLAACLTLCFSQESQAHGRFPTATAIAVRDDGRALAVVTSFGVLMREAPEAPFQFTCLEALDAEYELQLSARFEGDVLELASPRLRIQSPDLGCTWSVEQREPLPADRPQVQGASLDLSDVFEQRWLAKPTEEGGPNLVLARTVRGDRVLQSVDGLEHRQVLQLMGPLLAFTQHPEGGQLWLGGDQDGLWHSLDQGQSFSQLDARRQVTCLTVAGNQLYACEAAPTAPFQVGRSLDEGRSFEPLLHFAELRGLTSCPGSAHEVLCNDAWTHEEPELSVFRAARPGAALPDAGPSPAGDASSVDAAAEPLAPSAPTQEAQAGGCSVRTRRGNDAASLLALCGLWVLRSARQRRTA